MPLTRSVLKNLKSLSTRKGRRTHGLFAAEGVRLVMESLRHRMLPRSVYYSPSILGDEQMDIVERFQAADVQVEKIPAAQLRQIADTKTPQGIVAVFELPEEGGQLSLGRFRRVLLCESVADPGNLGSLIRSALAFDFDAVLLSGESADAYSPKVVRSTMGAIFGLTVARTEVTQLAKLLADSDVRVLATDTSGITDRRRLKSLVASPTLLVAIGSEATGLSETLLDRCDVVWRIAHSRNVESLNAAIAGSIIMKEVYDCIHGS